MPWSPGPWGLHPSRQAGESGFPSNDRSERKKGDHMKRRCLFSVLLVTAQLAIGVSARSETAQTLSVPYPDGMNCVWPSVAYVPTENCAPNAAIRESGIITSSMARASVPNGLAGLTLSEDYVGKENVTPFTRTFKISATAAVSRIASTPRHQVCLVISERRGPAIQGTSEYLQARPSAVSSDCIPSGQPLRELSTSFEGTFFAPRTLSVYVSVHSWGEQITTIPYENLDRTYLGATIYQVERITYSTI